MPLGDCFEIYDVYKILSFIFTSFLAMIACAWRGSFNVPLKGKPDESIVVEAIAGKAIHFKQAENDFLSGY